VTMFIVNNPKIEQFMGHKKQDLYQKALKIWYLDPLISDPLSTYSDGIWMCGTAQKTKHVTCNQC